MARALPGGANESMIDGGGGGLLSGGGLGDGMRSSVLKRRIVARGSGRLKAACCQDSCVND